MVTFFCMFLSCGEITSKKKFVAFFNAFVVYHLQKKCNLSYFSHAASPLVATLLETARYPLEKGYFLFVKQQRC